MLVGAPPGKHLRMTLGGRSPADKCAQSSKRGPPGAARSTPHFRVPKKGEKIPQAHRACRCDNHELNGPWGEQTGGEMPTESASLPHTYSIDPSFGGRKTRAMLSVFRKLVVLPTRASEKLFFFPPSHPHHFTFTAEQLPSVPATLVRPELPAPSSLASS